jgi:DNA-binding response OmpR family regulator
MNAKIMVVDDDPAMLTLTEILLLRKGFTVVAAGNAHCALTLLNQEKPHLLILDLMMPGMTGLDLCRALRAQPDTAQIPVLILSDRFDSEVIQLGRAVGANEYMQKTSQPAHIVATVRRLLGQSNHCAAIVS